MVPHLRALLGVAVVAASLPVTPAQAARPMITDDARIVDERSCQVESWLRREKDRSEPWALPGCNVAGFAELTGGGGRFHEAGGPRASDLLLQAKALLRPLKTNDWGAATSIGYVRHRPVGGGPTYDDYYVNVPLSLSVRDDQLTLHANAGWLHEGVTGGNRATWGLAVEAPLHPRVGLVTEAFGQVSRDSYYQLGVRFWIVPDRVQVDTTYGNRIGGGQARWFSIGLRLLSPAFLP